LPNIAELIRYEKENIKIRPRPISITGFPTKIFLAAISKKESKESNKFKKFMQKSHRKHAQREVIINNFF
jgi:hypothetical protein